MEAPLYASGNPFRYTGRKLDPETGLYYYRARYYDPGHGRFLETDPVFYDDQMNLYAYVHNDPVNNIDPDGEFTILAAGIVGAAIGGVTEAIVNKDATAGSIFKATLVGGAQGAVAGATGLGAAKLAANAGKLGKALVAAGEIGANGVTAGSISAAGEALTGGDATAGFANGAIGGAAGTGAGKLLESIAPGLTGGAGQKIAEGIDKALHFPKRGAAPSVANGENIGEVVGEVVGNTAGAVSATSTCAAVDDPC